MELQLLLGHPQRMPGRRHVGRPIGREDHQAGWLWAAREHREQVDRRRVAPVQILEDEHERRLCGHHVERFYELAQHSLPRRAVGTALHGLEFCVGDERRELHEPRRRMLLENAHDLVPAWLATQAAERLEHRQIGLARAVLLHALTMPDP